MGYAEQRRPAGHRRTADKNMRYQQNLEGRRIALVVLSTPQWPVVKLHLKKIAAAVNAATTGSYIEVDLR